MSWARTAGRAVGRPWGVKSSDGENKAPRETASEWQLWPLLFGFWREVFLVDVLCRFSS